jgi:hypothetical protein
MPGSELRDVDVGGNDVLVGFRLLARPGPTLAFFRQKVALGDDVDGVARVAGAGQGIGAPAKRVVLQELAFRVHFDRVSSISVAVAPTTACGVFGS